MLAAKIHLSFLVPTTAAREVFWPFLAWNLEKQVRAFDFGTKLEIVILSDTNGAYECIRQHFATSAVLTPSIVHVPELTELKLTLGQKRNLLLDCARGEYAAWVDDDDWHNPLLRPFGRAYGRPPTTWATRTGIRFLDLESERVWVPHPKMQTALPQLVVGRRDIMRGAKFPSRMYGEDVFWFEALRRTPGVIEPHESGSEAILALVHRDNTRPLETSVPQYAYDPRFSLPLVTWLDLERSTSAWPLLWHELEAQLAKLRTRLYPQM